MHLLPSDQDHLNPIIRRTSRSHPARVSPTLPCLPAHISSAGRPPLGFTSHLTVTGWIRSGPEGTRLPRAVSSILLPPRWPECLKHIGLLHIQSSPIFHTGGDLYPDWGRRGLAGLVPRPDLVFWSFLRMHAGPKYVSVGTCFFS